MLLLSGDIIIVVVDPLMMLRTRRSNPYCCSPLQLRFALLRSHNKKTIGCPSVSSWRRAATINRHRNCGALLPTGSLTGLGTSSVSRHGSLNLKVVHPFFKHTRGAVPVEQSTRRHRTAACEVPTHAWEPTHSWERKRRH